MLRRLSSFTLIVMACVLVACGGAAPQLIGSYPSTDSGNTYQPPPPDYVPSHLEITYNASLEIEVRDTYSAIYTAKNIASRYNGYLLSSRTWGRDSDVYGEVVIAVPSYNFDSARGDLRWMGTVLSEEMTGELDYVGPGWEGGGAYSNITVSLKPESANLGRKVWGGVQWVGRVVALLVPPILMIIGFITVIRWVAGRFRRREPTA